MQKKHIKHSLLFIVIVVTMLMLLARTLFCIVTIKGNSMYPTLCDGDKVLVLRTKKVKRGDIVLINVPSTISVINSDRLNVKRIIALSGDEVYAQNGAWLNNTTGIEYADTIMRRALASEPVKVLNEKYGVFTGVFPFDDNAQNITSTSIRTIPYSGMRIPKLPYYSRVLNYEGCNAASIINNDYCFILGDNPFDSRDSRYYGPIPMNEVKGKVLCHLKRNADKALEAALRSAGANRAELEKVLAYCRNDELKYKSAVFLIRNMPGHYSYMLTAEDEKVRDRLADIYKGYGVIDEDLREYALAGRKKVRDIDVITSDYLIDNISEAVKSYIDRPWKRSLPFDDFCNLILPYRVGTEPLQNWRKVYKERYSHILDSLYTGTDPIEATNIIFKALDGQLFMYFPSFRMPNLGPDFLLNNRIGGCREICDFTLYLMRALGLPVATDFYNQQNIHSWNVIRDLDGKYVQFLFNRYGGNEAVRGGSDGRTKGKVWRQNFSKPFISDVTTDYFPENKYSVKCKMGLPARVVGLGMFTNAHWYSVYGCKSAINKVTFRNIEPQTVYIAMGSKGSTISYPFIPHNDGTITYLKPETNNRRNVIIKRKVRITNHLKEKMKEVDGTSVCGYNEESQHLDSIGTLYSSISNDEVIYADGKEYSHIIINPNSSGNICLAELSIIATDGTKVPFTGANELCDDDPLTYFRSNGPITLYVKNPTRIAKIIWTPQNDDNFVRIGDSYELFYQNGEAGWVSLGMQEAKYNFLIYNNVPANALLWLHDHTRGREEEVFIIDESGYQIFL